MKFLELATSWELSLSSCPVLKWFSVPYGLHGSVEKKNFLVTRTNVLQHSPRSFIKLPWSIVRRNLSFPLLRRPNTVLIQFWITCWESLSGCPDRTSTTTDFQGSWYPCQVLPGFDEVEDDTTDGILAMWNLPICSSHICCPCCPTISSAECPPEIMISWSTAFLQMSALELCPYFDLHFLRQVSL